MFPTKCRFIWPSGFRGEDFKKNWPIKNKHCLWRPCLLMDRDEMSNLYRGPSIDALYQVSVHLDEGFQRSRLKCEKLTDDRRRNPSDGKSSHWLWQGELKRKAILKRMADISSCSLFNSSPCKHSRTCFIEYIPSVSQKIYLYQAPLHQSVLQFLSWHSVGQH